MAKLTSNLQQSFMKVAAAVIILLAVFNANNILALSGSPYTLDAVAYNAWCIVSYCTPVVAAAAPVDTANLLIEENGYSPRTLTVRAGAHVTLNLENRGGTGCTQAFTIPSLGVQKIVPNGGSAVVTFDAPQQPGQLSFMCSMGMYRGTIQVI
jgi:plastocyanin domain-containing protein